MQMSAATAVSVQPGESCRTMQQADTSAAATMIDVPYREA